MFKSKEFYKYKSDLINLLEGQTIKSIEYAKSVLPEENYIEIDFADESYFIVSAMLRIIEQGQIVLTSLDYYFDKNNERIVDEQIENTLIQDALIKANNLLKNKVIDKVELNERGDAVIKINSGIYIEIYVDTTANHKDYYTFYGKQEKDTYVSVIKIKDELRVVDELD